MTRLVSTVSECTINILLNGNPSLSWNDNKFIFDAVHQFISETGYFVKKPSNHDTAWKTTAGYIHPYLIYNMIFSTFTKYLLRNISQI